jgi:hypothetical protein
MRKLKSKVEMQTLVDDVGIFTEVSGTTQSSEGYNYNGGGHDTNSVVTVSQASRPTRYNYNGSRKSQGIV